MPKVSVIIPIYGVEKYIERCAISLFEQTLDDIEYIFVDDCTPDSSIEILKSIIEKYRLRLTAEKKTMRIEQMPTNSGLPAARQHGVQLATGNYIIHCDSDDWVDTDMYKALYVKAIEGNYDMVACDYFESDGSNHKEVQEVIPADGTQLASYILTKKTHSVLWNKIIKRSVYELAKIDFPRCNNAEDYATLSQLSLFINTYTVLRQPLYFWYFNPQSITRIVSRDNLIERFNNSCDNIRLTEAYFHRNNKLLQYVKEFDFIKTNEMKLLLKYISEQDFYDLWKKYSTELTMRPICNNYLTFRDKLRYYSVKYKSYPILKKLHLI